MWTLKSQTATEKTLHRICIQCLEYLNLNPFRFVMFLSCILLLPFKPIIILLFLCHDFIVGLTYFGKPLVETLYWVISVNNLKNSISGCDRREFEEEARMLSLPGVARDPNIAPLLGANMDEDACFVLREFSEQGDLTQFLQNHVAESSGSTLSDIPTLR